MKRIGRSKVPYVHQLASMAENLAKKFNRTVFVEFNPVFYMPECDLKTRFRISFVSGFSGEDCTAYVYYNWEETLDKYFSLMKESVND